jgi:hypothetical protein
MSNLNPRLVLMQKVGEQAFIAYEKKKIMG